jgi:hypothetical protein
MSLRPDKREFISNLKNISPDFSLNCFENEFTEERYGKRTFEGGTVWFFLLHSDTDNCLLKKFHYTVRGKSNATIR